MTMMKLLRPFARLPLRPFVLALLLAAPLAAQAQTSGDNLKIYLVTFGPGDEVFEKFGHNALLVQDEALGYGVAYNWGMFDFDQPGFVPRLMKGRMLYWMAGYDGAAFIDLYIRTNRNVWVQELNIPPAQRAAMRDFLEWNAREENKYYRYDYYRDNCSTRVRDALDRFTGGALSQTLKATPTTETYRSHTQALTFSSAPVYTGLMLAMGPNIDRPLSAWEESFIPMELLEWVRQVKVRAPDGTEQPLVVSERLINEARGREPIAEHAPNMVPWYVIAGIVLACLLVLLGRAARAKRGLAIITALVVGVICFAVGFFGLLITLLWAFTDHVVTYGNENVLQANPLSLVLLVFAPAALLGKLWARRWAAWFALLIAGLSTIGFVIQLLPGLDQHNGEIIGLLMPLHGAIAWILWKNWKDGITASTEARRA